MISKELFLTDQAVDSQRGFNCAVCARNMARLTSTPGKRNKPPGSGTEMEAAVKTVLCMSESITCCKSVYCIADGLKG